RAEPLIVCPVSPSLLRLAVRCSGQVAMNRSKQAGMGKTVVVLLVGLALVSVHLAEAQEPAKVCVLGSSSASFNASRDDGLRPGLREIGYVEGKNIIMEYRYAEGKLRSSFRGGCRPIGSQPDVILVGGTRVAVAAKQATTVIPIVVTGAGDLVAAG